MTLIRDTSGLLSQCVLDLGNKRVVNCEVTIFRDLKVKLKTFLKVCVERNFATFLEVSFIFDYYNSYFVRPISYTVVSLFLALLTLSVLGVPDFTGCHIK